MNGFTTLLITASVSCSTVRAVYSKRLGIAAGGLHRIATFSFDDGSENDARLVERFDKYNLKATFHLNGGIYEKTDYLGKL